MKTQDNHPGIQKFRAARAKGKAIAIARKEVLKNNPELTEQQAQQIAERQWELNRHK